MKFSVIIPAFNAEKTIVSCLDSLTGQAYENLEIIVVDDGSVDGTQKTVQDYIAKNGEDRIVYVKTENKGPSSARNTGLKTATGDYVCFLDSDDCYEKDLFLSISKLNTEFDVCYFGYREIDENGKVVFNYTDKFAYLSDINGLNAVQNKFRKKIWICNCNAVYKREMLINFGVKYIEGVYHGEDTNFIYKSLLNAKKVVSLPHEYFINNIRKSSLMHSDFSKRNLTEFTALKDLLEYAKEKGYGKDTESAFYSLYYCAKISVAKKIVDSLPLKDIFKFKKIYKQNVPCIEKQGDIILTKKEKLEDLILRTSKALFFLFVKIYYGFKK